MDYVDRICRLRPRTGWVAFAECDRALGGSHLPNATVHWVSRICRATGKGSSRKRCIQLHCIQLDRIQLRSIQLHLAAYHSVACACSCVATAGDSLGCQSQVAGPNEALSRGAMACRDQRWLMTPFL